MKRTISESIEYLQSIGFELNDELYIPGNELDCETFLYFKASSIYNITFDTNFISEWESDGVIIFIDDVNCIQYVSIDDIETFLKIVKFTQ